MSSVKIKADLEYGSVSFTVVGLVNKEDYENNDFGLGYIEGSDMMTDAEGFDMHTVLEGSEELEAYYKISDGEVGTATVTILD
jgi:hypothetical protein